MGNNIKTINHLQKSYTFLDYEVLPELREIHRVKTPIKMSKKSFDILLVLIENQGRVVTKEQLIEKVWPNQVVTDAALNKQITRLRNDLAGNDTTTIIETVRGVGIKLIPPVNQIITENTNTDTNNYSKKWWLIALASLVALFSYVQFNKNSNASQTKAATLSLHDTMVEIRSAMSINKKAFISQIKRRNELGEMLNKRFDIEKDLSWERRFLNYHDKMNEGELFVFSQIRAYTEGPLLSSNQQILDLINAKKEIIDEIPSADKLRNHLILWLNKYQKIFKNNAKMSLLYVGVEDGAPYPSEVDEQVINWLEKNNLISSVTSIAKKSLNIAIVPSQKTSDWLNVGGLNYLAEQLQKHNSIQTINPHNEWFDERNSQSLAIELFQNDGIDYVLAVTHLIIGKQYTADLNLKSKKGTIAKKTIEANGITSLFDKIDSWVIRQLNIYDTIATGEITGYKTSDFVLESYLRGREVAIHKSYEKALQLFQTATSQDAHFIPAWIGQAEAEARLGNNEKALAIVDNISKSNNFNQANLNEILVLKATFLTGLNKLDQADKLLDQAIELSNQKGDNRILIDAIAQKIMAHFNLGTISQGTIDLLLQQISLIKKFQPDPALLALASYNLAGAYHNLGQIDSAMETINYCIKLYTKANNVRGIVISNSLLARIYKDTGDSSMALLVLDRVAGYYDQMDGIDEQQIYLQYRVENLIYAGLRTEAFKTIDKIERLSLNTSSLETKIIALALRFELNEIHKNYNQARVNVTQMFNVLKNNSVNYPPFLKDMILAYDIFISALADKPQVARLVVKKHLESNPNIKIFFEKELRMIEATILTKEDKTFQASTIYRTLIKGYINDNRLQEALYYAGYPLLDIQWENNMQDYVKTMNYLDEISTFKYPIHKYKAQYLAYKKDYINAYTMMVDLKSKANEFWTTEDQIKLEEYQQKALGK